ncbi:hypothetical protein QR680_009531 [Steinernema hermaphroditum]|uniref:Tropomyosin n=1 Tax=Steinernema hermaphroditum TaxID=289476 RepID=A0AA39MA27_9BILA|nr:hypothetical protein QR680_009531 [Steinernema hermaphroditum]
MDAIKKKMQAMKIEKDNALDRADAAEEKVRQMQEKLERVEEELRDTQKKMVQVENDCDKAQEDLAAANASLEEKEKKLQEPLGSLSALVFAHFACPRLLASLVALQCRRTGFATVSSGVPPLPPPHHRYFNPPHSQ